MKLTTSRLHRIFAIDRMLVLRKLGSIDTEEYEEILAKVISLLKWGRFKSQTWEIFEDGFQTGEPSLLFQKRYDGPCTG